MNDYFEQLILDQVFAGAIDEAQADFLKNFFAVMTPEQKTELEAALRAEPRLIPFMIENIGKKITAIDSGSMEKWEEVVADEIQKLDALEN